MMKTLMAILFMAAISFADCSSMGWGSSVVCPQTDLSTQVEAAVFILGGILLVWMALQMKDTVKEAVQ